MDKNNTDKQKESNDCKKEKIEKIANSIACKSAINILEKYVRDNKKGK